MVSEKAELAACPFCGSGDSVKVGPDCGMWRVSCDACGTDGPLNDHYEGAVEEWNAAARAVPAGPDASEAQRIADRLTLDPVIYGLDKALFGSAHDLDLAVRRAIRDLRAMTCPAEFRAALTGVALIAAERQRQIAEEDWPPDHDDQHTHAQLAIEAARYAVEGTDASVHHPDDDDPDEDMPEYPGWTLAFHRAAKPRLRQLVIAGALIAAEIDRLQRLAPEAAHE